MTGLLCLHIGWASSRATAANFKAITKTPDKLRRVSMYLFEEYLVEQGLLELSLLQQFRQEIAHKGKKSLFFVWSEAKYSAKTIRSLKVNTVEKIIHLTFADDRILWDSLINYTIDRPITTIDELRGVEKTMLWIWMCEVFFVRRLTSFLAYSDEIADENRVYVGIHRSVFAARDEWMAYARRYMGFKFGTSAQIGLGTQCIIPVIEDKDFKIAEWNKCWSLLEKIASKNEITI